MKALNYEQINNTFDLNYTPLESYIKLDYKENNHDYSKDYFTVTALEDGSFTFGYPDGFSTLTGTSLSYSTDEGETWTTLTNVDNTEVIVDGMSISEGDKILFKGINFKTNCENKDLSFYGLMFISTGTVEVSGNIMSLIDENNFETINELSTEGIFGNLFRNSQKGYPYGLGEKLVSAENLVLPATTLSPGCYRGMFNGCTSLTTAPELPATTLAEWCYSGMFQACESLILPPELPSTQLAVNCYSEMFKGCSLLVTAPELPATTLSNLCYQYMFRDCISLTTAPELPATTLVNGCYQEMFNGCTSLTAAPELPATTLSSLCYQGMFNGCTSLATASELPATTLVNGCYMSMFSGCTSLTTAPKLPALGLVTDCYIGMFNGCTSLNYIKAMFTTTPGPAYTTNWVKNVSSNGTFIKNADATWSVTGNNGIPTNWMVGTASE